MKKQKKIKSRNKGLHLKKKKATNKRNKCLKKIKIEVLVRW